MKRKILGGVVAAAAMFGLGATAVGAAPPADKPDTACMQAGLSTLQELGLLSTVAADGLPITFAVEQAGVTVRPGADISGVPDPIPLKVVLADHRAGDNSLFIYPWCS